MANYKEVSKSRIVLSGNIGLIFENDELDNKGDIVYHAGKFYPIDVESKYKECNGSMAFNVKHDSIQPYSGNHLSWTSSYLRSRDDIKVVRHE